MLDFDKLNDGGMFRDCRSRECGLDSLSGSGK